MLQFELGTCRSEDRSYTHCRYNDRNHVITKMWWYKHFHNRLKSSFYYVLSGKVNVTGCRGTHLFQWGILVSCHLRSNLQPSTKELSTCTSSKYRWKVSINTEFVLHLNLYVSEFFLLLWILSISIWPKHKMHFY